MANAVRRHSLISARPTSTPRSDSSSKVPAGARAPTRSPDPCLRLRGVCTTAICNGSNVTRRLIHYREPGNFLARVPHCYRGCRSSGCSNERCARPTRQTFHELVEEVACPRSSTCRHRRTAIYASGCCRHGMSRKTNDWQCWFAPMPPGDTLIIAAGLFCQISCRTGELTSMVFLSAPGTGGCIPA